MPEQNLITSSGFCNDLNVSLRLDVKLGSCANHSSWNLHVEVWCWNYPVLDVHVISAFMSFLMLNQMERFICSFHFYGAFLGLSLIAETNQSSRFITRIQHLVCIARITSLMIGNFALPFACHLQLLFDMQNPLSQVFVRHSEGLVPNVSHFCVIKELFDGITIITLRN